MKKKWPRALRRQKVSSSIEGMVVRAPRAEIIFSLFWEGGGGGRPPSPTLEEGGQPGLCVTEVDLTVPCTEWCVLSQLGTQSSV